ncbi:MAG: WecB/TagA/CpsF family glycosyltransferase [Actinomycetaceae bacterium]
MTTSATTDARPSRAQPGTTAAPEPDTAEAPEPDTAAAPGPVTDATTGPERPLPASRTPETTASLELEEPAAPSDAVPATGAHARVELAGVVVDLMNEPGAVEAIVGRAAQPPGFDRAEDAEAHPPLAVVSANLDHIVQFGRSGRWRHLLGDSLHPTTTDVDGTVRPLEWLNLLDGAPLVARSNQLTGRIWPRLAGSDLADPVLDAAERAGVSVGFLGGSYLVQRLLSRRLTRTRPGLTVAGMWSPERSELSDDAASLDLAAAIAEAGPQILFVGLGKPRQELWISRYGPATGANVLLAFGAVVDFLADAVQRAPHMVSSHGLEWAWRLAKEPRRLATRYLVDDPPGLLELRRDARALPTTPAPPVPSSPPVRPTPGPDATAVDATAVEVRSDAAPEASARSEAETGGTFVPEDRPADVAVLVVTHNSADHVESLVASLRHEARGLRLRVVVADNSSTDGTLDLLERHPDVISLATGGNLGYAAGINAAAARAGETEALLVLNPDLEVQPGAVAALLAVIRSGTARLVVPRLVDEDGTTRLSLYREPTAGTIVGDALLGNRWAKRPAALGGTDQAPESYQFAHEIDWATGAALMVQTEAARRIGAWDESYFLYSEETEYFRRARELGMTAWYEPRATMLHVGSASGASPHLAALMSVNTIRYARHHLSPRAAAVGRAGVLLGEALRSHRPERRGVLGLVADESRWAGLPGPRKDPDLSAVLEDFPSGSVVVPAHDEAAVIDRTLAALAPVLATGRVEVVVVCNGCTDDTAARAAAVDGVRVVEIPVASKTAALNEGDRHVTTWPRVYLDADTEIGPAALRGLLEALGGSVPAARPAVRYDVGRASRPVRAYFRARRRLPSTGLSLWGAGVFGLSEEGRARFGEFPDVTADDYFVDWLFSGAEKSIVPGSSVPVRTPRDTRSLMKVLRRQHRGPAEQRTAGEPSSARGTARELAASVRGPHSLVDAVTYAGLAAGARLRLRPGRERPRWERDDSTRVAPSSGTGQEGGSWS